MGSAHHALKWLELEEILTSPTASSFFKNEEGTVVDNHDDMESPIREVGCYKKRGARHDMHTDGEHHHDMYVGVEFKFEKCHALSPFRTGGVSFFGFSSGSPSLDHLDEFFPPFELAGFLCLNSLLVHHLWIIHMNSL